jgi:hypothetical protein
VRQCRRPERSSRECRRFVYQLNWTPLPSPILQSWNTTAPAGCSRCSFRRTPGRLFRGMLASGALRTSIGARRRSLPFSSRRSRRRGTPAARSAYAEVAGTWPAPARHSTPPRRSGRTAPSGGSRPRRDQRVSRRPVKATAGDQPDADRGSRRAMSRKLYRA